jgi:hypothetical protein
MTQRSKAHEAKNFRSSEVQNFRSRLNSFFRTHSTFEVRWAKSWRKDSISRGVYKDEFMNQDEGGFTRKEMKKLIEWGIIAEKSYTDPRKGGRRAAVIYVGELLPQVTPFKKFMARFNQATAVAGLVVLIVFILTLMVLSLTPWKKAFGFTRAPARINIQYDSEPPATIKYFDDTEAKVRCYWFGESTYLSCVKR